MATRDCPECPYDDWAHDSHVYFARPVSQTGSPWYGTPIAFRTPKERDDFFQSVAAGYGHAASVSSDDGKSSVHSFCGCNQGTKYHADDPDECDDADEWKLEACPVVTRHSDDPRGTM